MERLLQVSKDAATARLPASSTTRGVIFTLGGSQARAAGATSDVEQPADGTAPRSVSVDGEAIDNLCANGAVKKNVTQSQYWEDGPSHTSQHCFGLLRLDGTRCTFSSGRE